jgi:hypothetical protein
MPKTQISHTDAPSPSAHSGGSSDVSRVDPGSKPGRKRGKHSDENYAQTSIYLPVTLRNRVRARLYEEGLEMSGLVEGLLRDWLVGLPEFPR